MSDKVIGIAVSAPNASAGLDRIVRAEELGVRAAWLTSGGGGGDAPTLLAAAAAQTERILLGTSIMQIWSRQPVAVGHFDGGDAGPVKRMGNGGHLIGCVLVLDRMHPVTQRGVLDVEFL